MNPFTRFFKTKETTPTLPTKEEQDTALLIPSVFQTLFGGFDYYNPDQLIARKGKDIYYKMLKDPQVRSAFTLRINIIISRDWRFDILKPSHVPIARFFERNIREMLYGTWGGVMRSVLMGKAYGFSVNEKLYRIETMDSKTRWILSAVKTKPFWTFEFGIDEYGNLKELKQRIDSKVRNLDPNKFIIYINHPEIDPIWGESDLQAVYRPYWEKDNILKFWNIYLERMAGGFVSATPNEKAVALSPAEKTDFQNMLKRITVSSSIISPMGYDVKMEKGVDTRSFEKAIQHRDLQIAKGLLVPNLLGFSEQGQYGTYAQASVQLDAFMMTIAEEGDYVADVMNEQVFKELAKWNFDTDDFPQFMFEPYTLDQKRAIAESWSSAVQKGAVKVTVEDDQRVRELVGFPPLSEEEIKERKKEEKEKREAAREQRNNPQQQPNPEGKAPRKPELEIKPPPSQPNQRSAQPVKPTSAVATDENDLKEQITQDIISKLEKKFSKNTQLENKNDALEISYTNRVDFIALNEDLDGVESNFIKSMGGSVDKILRELEVGLSHEFDQLPKNRKEADIEKIMENIKNTISSKTKSELQQGIKKNLKDGYEIGREYAQGALGNAVKDAPKDVKNKIKSIVSLSPRLSSKRDDWSFMDFVDGLALEVADAWFKTQSFTITGDITEEMMAAAVEVMKDGILNEKDVRDVIKGLSERLPTLVGSKDPITGKPDKAERARLETIARTNLSAIYTQSQLAVYADPELGDFVKGLEYAAVLDRRTTQVCSSLHGRKYKIDDPIWSHITPPNHFNCRSVLIPITILDDWRSSSKKD